MRQLRRTAIVTSIVLLSVHAAPADAQRVRADQTPSAQARVATVNGEEISTARFLALIGERAYPKGASPFAAPPDVMRAVIPRLIDYLLVEQEARRAGAVATESDVSRALAIQKAAFPTEAAWKQYLRLRRGGETELRHTVRQRLLRERLAEPQQPITQRDVQEYYDRHRERYDSPPALALIVVPFASGDPSEESVRAARARAEEFAAIARTGSLALAAHQRGGPAAASTVRLTEKTADPALWRAASALEPEAVSEPIRAADGYHVVQVVRRIPAVRRSMEEVREEISRGLRETRRAQAEAALLARLRANARIQHHLMPPDAHVSAGPLRARPLLDLLPTPVLMPVPPGTPAARGARIGRP